MFIPQQQLNRFGDVSAKIGLDRIWHFPRSLDRRFVPIDTDDSLQTLGQRVAEKACPAIGIDQDFACHLAIDKIPESRRYEIVGWGERARHSSATQGPVLPIL